MKSLDLSFEAVLPPALLRCGLAAALCLVPATLSPENVSLSTFYPAPSGVYTQLQSVQRAWLATAGGGVSIGTSLNAPASGLVVMPQKPGQTTLTNGRVGVGTLNPQDVLEVDGVGVVPAWLPPGQGLFGMILGGSHPEVKLNGAVALDYIPGGALTLGGGGPVLVQNGASVAMAVVGGKVGIGTANPKAAVDVAAGAITALCLGGSAKSFKACPGGVGCAGAVFPCPGGSYATWFPGVISDKDYGTAQTSDGSGQMYCCPCVRACPSLP